MELQIKETGVPMANQKALAFFDAGNALYEQGKYDEAIAQYEQATSADPNFASAFNNWGNALAAQKKYDEAIEKYARAAELDPKFASAFDNWGLALAAQKKYDEAIEKYKRATELDPNNASIFFNLGYAIYELKRYSDVVDTFEQAIKADPNSVASVYAAHNIADFLQRQGKYKESSEAWEKARQEYQKHIQTAKDSADAEYFLNYGDILRDSLRKFDDAEKIYKQGLVHDPNHAGIWAGLVNLHLAKMEDNGEESAKERTTGLLWPFGNGAREAQALESDSQKSDNYWKARDAYKKAESIFQRRRKEAKDVSILLQLGELYLKVEDYRAAECMLLEAMSEDKESPQPVADLGVLYSRKGDYARAVQYFEQALQKDIDDLTVRSNLAEACLKAKMVERSEAEYKKILGVTPLHVESHIGLGEVYTAMGDAGDGDRYDEAISCFDRGILHGKSGYGSKRLKKKTLSAPLYSRGYAKVKLYEASKRPNDENPLHSALDDFRESYKNDSENHRAKRAIDKLEKRLYHFSRRSALERIGPWLLTILSLVVFILSQSNFFFSIPGKQIDTGYYVLLTFGSLMFILAGLSLTQLLKLKVAGIELEKSAVDQITTSGGLGISK